MPIKQHTILIPILSGLYDVHVCGQTQLKANESRCKLSDKNPLVSTNTGMCPGFSELVVVNFD